MATPVSLMDDQMVDMAFITQLTGLTDKRITPFLSFHIVSHRHRFILILKEIFILSCHIVFYHDTIHA